VNKKKIINDPIYGFITIYSELIFDVIETPEFQRLRRINQMGLADLVYPGALHTRFHHALGAMHLMSRALDNLRGKGHEITNEEYEAALLAILLHDIGHGPFSHSLENILRRDVNHEVLSLAIMDRLNHRFGGALDLAIAMFTNDYERPFFHQLISSQLDVDRLDYLNRDSFFTGVSEGTIGAERILKLLDVVNNEIVVEEKGIYSIEHFLNARRLMYWQVYLHKTGLAADKMLLKIIERARFVMNDLITPKNENSSFENYISRNMTAEIGKEELDTFCNLDDHDVWASIKKWQQSDDQILSFLSKSLLNRRLFKIKLQNEDVDNEKQILNLSKNLDLNSTDLSFLYDEGTITNAAYIKTGKKIKLLKKSGEVINIEDATDLPNIKGMSSIISKYYFCWANEVNL
jgi:HD superfamily phosphohydrolase